MAQNALVLAGGLPQLALIQKLKARGIRTVLVDYLERPVAMPYADVFYRESTLDIEVVKQIAIQEQVDFILTVCTDQALLTMALVSEQLHLPCYIDFQTAQNVTNKQYMKEILLARGISTPKAVFVANGREKLSGDLQYPLVCKPVDCNSSKGVKKCATPAELEIAIAKASQLSRSKKVIIEDYKKGIELSVDAFVLEGSVHILLISELRKIRGRDAFVIWQSGLDRHIPRSLYEKIGLTLQEIAAAFSLRNCPLLVQMIVSDEEEVFVLEFSARTGGGEKYQVIKRLTGNDVIEDAIRLTLGESVVLQTAPVDILYETTFLYCKKGIYDHTEGVEALKEKGIIADYYPFKSSGTAFLGKAENSSDRVAGYTVIAKTREELHKKLQEAQKHIKVMDVFGNDITLKTE